MLIITRDYVSESFEFEKLSILYLLSINIDLKIDSQITKIQIQEEATDGDIDAVVLFQPNKIIRFQIKSNKSLKNVTNSSVLPGILQLLKYFTKSPITDVNEREYILVHEGNSSYNHINSFYTRKRSVHQLYWLNKIEEHGEIKKYLTSEGYDDLEKRKDLINRFIVNFRIILIPNRKNIKESLEILFDENQLLEIYGKLGYNRTIEDIEILKLIQKKKGFKIVKLDKDSISQDEFDDWKGEHNKQYGTVYNKFKVVEENSENIKNLTKHNIKNYLIGDYYMGKFYIENSLKHEKIIDLKKSSERKLEMTSGGNFTDLREFTEFLIIYQEKVGLLLGENYSEEEKLMISCFAVGGWLIDCNIDFR